MNDIHLLYLNSLPDFRENTCGKCSNKLYLCIDLTKLVFLVYYYAEQHFSQNKLTLHLSFNLSSNDCSTNLLVYCLGRSTNTLISFNTHQRNQRHLVKNGCRSCNMFVDGLGLTDGYIGIHRIVGPMCCNRQYSLLKHIRPVFYNSPPVFSDVSMR